MAIGGTGARHIPTPTVAAPPRIPVETRPTFPPPETAFGIPFPASSPRAAPRLCWMPQAALAAVDLPAISVGGIEAAAPPAVANGETAIGMVRAIGKSTAAALTSERRGAASGTAYTMTATIGSATRATNATRETSESRAISETCESSATNATSATSPELDGPLRPHCAPARPSPSEEISAMPETHETRP